MDDDIRQLADRIRNEIPITDVVSEFSVVRNSRAECPFHDDVRPSLSVDPANTWNCYPCGQGGDAIHLIMEPRHVDFISAVRSLAQRLAG